MMMLGSQCSPCCDPCNCPSGQSLPEVVTVTFSGLTSNCPVSQFNGKSFLLKRTGEKSCAYRKCYGLSDITVLYRGHLTPPTVSIGGACEIAFTADESDAPFDCSPIAFTATEPLGGTATVEEGDAESIISCEDVWDATALLVEVHAQDWLAKYRRPILPAQTSPRPCPHAVAATVGFAGSQYAGEFELSLYDTTRLPVPNATQKRFRYYYPPNPKICVDAYVEVSILRYEGVSDPRFGTYSFSAGVSGLTTITFRDHSAENYKTLGELTCDVFGDYQAFCSGTRQEFLTTGVGGGARCLCDLDSVLSGNAMGGVWPSDATFNMFPEQVSEIGSRQVTLGGLGVIE